MLILFYMFFFLQVSTLYFLQNSSLIDVVIYSYIIIDIITLILFFAKELKGKLFLCISLSLIVRFIFLIYMQMTGLKLSLDWGSFLKHAIAYMNGYTDRVAMYPRVLAFFFESSGFNCNFTVLPIALNIFSSVINIYIIFLILQYLQVNNKIKNYILCALCFAPIQMGYSVEMIRETLPTLFISVSLLFFTKWFFTNKIQFIILAFLCTFIASSFHAGCIAVALGYAYVFAFYNYKKNTLQITLSKILFCFPVIILFATYIALNSDVFLGKFSGVTDIESLEAELSGWGNLEAGSAYLTWLDGQNLLVQLLCLPLKAIYFLFSPMIYNVRGIPDLFILITDSSIFITAVGYYIYCIRKVKDTKIRLFISVLMFTLCIVALVFGLGTSNTGTAMRHRNKFIALPIILFSLLYTYNKNFSKGVQRA